MKATEIETNSIYSHAIKGVTVKVIDKIVFDVPEGSHYYRAKVLESEHLHFTEGQVIVVGSKDLRERRINVGDVYEVEVEVERQTGSYSWQWEWKTMNKTVTRAEGGQVYYKDKGGEKSCRLDQVGKNITHQRKQDKKAAVQKKHK